MKLLKYYKTSRKIYDVGTCQFINLAGILTLISSNIDFRVVNERNQDITISIKLKLLSKYFSDVPENIELLNKILKNCKS